MFGNDQFVRVFGSTPAGDDDGLIRIVAGAVKEGFAIVLNKPGTKIPMCILSARDANAADRKAQQEAATLGDPMFARRKHACGINHAMTVVSLTATEEKPEGDPTKVLAKVSSIIRRLTKTSGGVQPNIGVELGRSRMLVIDVDTEEEQDGFCADWADHNDGNGDTIPGMTVSSPGKQTLGGQWVHKNGGHYWFSLPDDVVLPLSSGALAADSGWVAMWDKHQVLVPPSTREEGAYSIIGQLEPAPRWLIEWIIAHARQRMERAASRGTLPDGTGDIDLWAARTPWADLLDGWTETGLPDRCSCPIWTAPGPHGSPKSATAHDLGCDHYDTSPGHAPLHVWTDNPPEWMAEAFRQTGSKTITKLQFLAWRDHSGVVAAALRELGLVGVDAEFPGFAALSELDSPLDQAMEEENPFEELGSGEGDASESTETPGVVPKQTKIEYLKAQLLTSAELDSIPKLDPLVDGILDLDSIARLTGKSGHGKSFVMLDLSACVATGKTWFGRKVTQGVVVYMVAEGARGWKKRVRAWERRFNNGEYLPDNFIILPMPVQTSSVEDWYAFRMVLKELKPSLVVLDTQARVTVGVDENDNTEMGKFVERLEIIRRETGACVVAVHHLGHQGEHGRGATAVIGALGAEIRVRKTEEGKLTVESEKQKDTGNFEPMKFSLDPEGDSVVLAPDGWQPIEPDTDPMLTPAPPLAGKGVDEKSSTRDRLAAILHIVFGAGRGATKGEALGILTTGHPVFGKAGKTQRFHAWTDLERDQVLVQQIGPNGGLTQRFKLDRQEADRLGLPPAV
jgi:hypothetical protein